MKVMAVCENAFHVCTHSDTRAHTFTKQIHIYSHSIAVLHQGHDLQLFCILTTALATLNHLREQFHSTAEIWHSVPYQ